MPRELRKRASRVNYAELAQMEEDSDRAPQVAQLERADVMTAQKDRAFVWVIETYNKFENGAFSSTVGSNDNLHDFVRGYTCLG